MTDQQQETVRNHVAMMSQMRKYAIHRKGDDYQIEGIMQWSTGGFVLGGRLKRRLTTLVYLGFTWEQFFMWDGRTG